MDRIESIEQYQGLIAGLRSKHGRMNTNCFSMNDYFIPFIEDGRLFYEEYPSGACVFMDEGTYYNLYYFLDPDAPFPEISLDKPVLIGEMNSGTARDAYIESAGKMFSAAGFRPFKTDHLYSFSIKDHPDREEKLESLYAPLREEGGYEMSEVRNQETLDEMIRLWESELDLMDIPAAHRRLPAPGGNAELFCLKHDGKVIGTYYVELQKSNSVGWHVVTAPGYTGRGIGRLMLLTGAGYVAANGSRNLTTWISDENERSIAVHERAGFTKLSRTAVQFIKDPE